MDTKFLIFLFQLSKKTFFYLTEAQNAKKLVSGREKYLNAAGLCIKTKKRRNSAKSEVCEKQRRRNSAKSEFCKKTKK